MAASSVTGTGPGSVEFYNSQQLTGIVSGPGNIIFSGQAQSEEELMISPPSNLATVNFQSFLPGVASDYLVFLTTINGGWGQVVNMFEDGGMVTGFMCMTEFPCTFNYMVIKSGNKIN